jgi:hypothetical protein
MKTVTMDYSGTLKCPNCGGDYLWHDRITDHYHGQEDIPQSTRTEIYKGPGSMAIVTAGCSQSARRHGFNVRSTCWDCPAKPELQIALRDGQTVVRWR